ncbi:bifunctional alpha,alpha-trehalose-phosphate synthase (UDP-forming)/trehalose-phosphatase [Hymenobacter taeanensis]|uniref:Alpha,alpha-trehalose-phosphate synthase n=1 Tax=Hymenobacter taeanensis TaxID=2735321 RepID=A0A6M6BHF9_9BACT|nr:MULTISPECIES: bifunctional alpha,alpha-trehalose-phosphate synthase (UDP-forming)/trehalose-phosphatase [Hymenobacter]QJX47536.1 bifunctional alpha,alpha-trehalose-phosphate synthase (UDP-forming)/trehalose-phosphatase [Hymenobacter taeanensis]UOQ82979.1 bifunctional alpha,alpha-trehalose-phosphate synthase (UDP-forming)/trehalose-phosphatase [Hymenobacter sp. 5414T-23]
MSRTIIVSNRLPTKVQRTANGLTFQPSEGGLATGLGSIYRAADNVWIGWPGLVVSDPGEQQQVTQRLQADSMAPVFLTEREIQDYYEGFSNGTLWPTFHYFSEYALYEEVHWEAYVAVNRKFCEAVLELAGPDDTIWVHDYQLLLLPEMLRRERPSATIGFFLHIPFPSYELLRELPWGAELLEGMLGADLIGFHTFSYQRHFLSAVSHMLGYPNQSGQVETPSRLVLVDAFPMGIDFKQYAETANTEAVARQILAYREGFREGRIVLSIDRLDYTKGIAQRLRAFEGLLQRHPEWHGKVSLLMVVVPSRDQVAQYQSLKEEIDELVGRLNAQFSTMSWTPIHYFYRSFPFEELVALYRLADIALVTPVRDGMNLVAKEYIACRNDERGVLILSERAGAAHELSDALLINPTDTNHLVEALNEALLMPEEEQGRRMGHLRALVEQYDVFAWTKLFMDRLAYSKIKQHIYATDSLDQEARAQLQARYETANSRLLLLDYDGTLVRFESNPQRAQPDAELLRLLSSLADDPRNRVVIISGRDRATLEKWLGHLPVDFIAEHGVWLRRAREEWQLFQELRADWKPEVRLLMELYVRRTAGASIEEKDYSLAWHYRRVDADLGAVRARELLSHLSFITSNTELQVLEGSKVLEVKNAGINKGTAVARWLQPEPPEFILALGDGRTDEDTFKALPAEAYTIKVGNAARSLARYCVGDSDDVRSLLQSLLVIGEVEILA